MKRLHTLQLSRSLPARTKARMHKAITTLARRHGLQPRWYKGGLSHYVAIYVPSTKRGDIKIKPGAFKRRVRSVERFLEAKFGGETTLFASGTYYSPRKHKYITEKIDVVKAYGKPSAINRYKADIKRFVTREKHAWGQEAISVEADKRLYFA